MKIQYMGLVTSTRFAAQLQQALPSDVAIFYKLGSCFWYGVRLKLSLLIKALSEAGPNSINSNTGPERFAFPKVPTSLSRTTAIPHRLLPLQVPVDSNFDRYLPNKRRWKRIVISTCAVEESPSNSSVTSYSIRDGSRYPAFALHSYPSCIHPVGRTRVITHAYNSVKLNESTTRGSSMYSHGVFASLPIQPEGMSRLNLGLGELISLEIKTKTVEQQRKSSLHPAPSHFLLTQADLARVTKSGSPHVLSVRDRKPFVIGMTYNGSSRFPLSTQALVESVGDLVTSRLVGRFEMPEKVCPYQSYPESPTLPSNAAVVGKLSASWDMSPPGVYKAQVESRKEPDLSQTSEAT
ncbi:hypothetical protein ACRALDRAFT_2014821 [Sodiomyces alcalophilus JCM 7366]|uniref:uncharacterized protein n=1 Tax=Sodiomyces alcalophilus JCM 7366 TaxID=591952 RepID=UPI0039B37391